MSKKVMNETQHLFHLLDLVEQKNEINRRRRRFWSYSRGLFKKITPQGEILYEWVDYPYMSRIEGEKGYQKAKQDGKIAGKRLRYVRQALGAKFHWDWSGNVCAVSYKGETIRSKNFLDKMLQLSVELNFTGDANERS